MVLTSARLHCMSLTSQDLNTIHGFLEEFQKKISEDTERKITSAINQLEIRISENLSIQQGEMNKKFSFLDKRFKKVDKRLDQIDDKFMAIDKQLETINQRFNGITAVLKDILDAVTIDQNERYSDHESRIHRLELHTKIS